MSNTKNNLFKIMKNKIILESETKDIKVSTIFSINPTIEIKITKKR